MIENSLEELTEFYFDVLYWFSSYWLNPEEELNQIHKEALEEAKYLYETRDFESFRDDFFRKAGNKRPTLTDIIEDFLLDKSPRTRREVFTHVIDKLGINTTEGALDVALSNAVNAGRFVFQKGIGFSLPRSKYSANENSGIVDVLRTATRFNFSLLNAGFSFREVEQIHEQALQNAIEKYNSEWEIE